MEDFSGIMQEVPPANCGDTDCKISENDMKLFFFDIPKNSFTVYIIGKTEIIKENVKGQHFMNERIASW